MTKATQFKTLIKRWLRRGGWATLIITALVVASIFIAMYCVLDTKRGTQWALQTSQRWLPELSFTQLDGAFLKGIRAEQIRWHSDDIDIEINRAELRLKFSPLLHGEINFATLHAQSLRITPLGPSSDEPIKLPRLFLPFTLSISEFALQRLDIVNTESTFSLRDIHSAMQWRATTLSLASTNLHWEDMSLIAHGDLGLRGDYPLQLNGKLTLPQWPSPIALRSQGNLRRLELIANTEAPYKLTSKIELATLDKNLPLKIHAELIEPLTQTIANEKITAETATLDANGDLTAIKAQLALTANDSRYGRSQLTATGHWRDERIILDTQWSPASGQLQLHCDAALHQPISTTCNGEVTALSLTPLLSGKTAEISSAIKLDAQWFDPKWALTLQLPNITGKFNDDALTAALDLHTDDGAQWQLQQLAATIGPNAIKASGEFGERYRLRANINATDLSHIDQRAGGNVVGDITIDGDTTPTVATRLRGSQLRFVDIQAASAIIDLNLTQLGNANSTGHIDIQQLARADVKPLNVIFDLSGKRQQQQWTLRATQQQQHAALNCATETNADWKDWKFICADFSGQLRAHENATFVWKNTAALRGNIQLAKKALELSPFCLRGDDTEFCLDQTLRIADAKPQAIYLHASGVPLRWASPWFPDTVELIGDARASAQLQLNGIAPFAAQGNIDIAATRWRWRTLKSTEITDIDAIRFDASLNEQRALFVTNIHSPKIGGIAAQLAVNDPRGKRELDGHFAIEKFQLAGIAWAFEGLDSISGEINGTIDVNGTSAAPQLRGQLLLTDGNALWAPLGAPFRTVHADLTFNNNSAKLGGWFALGQGGGDIDGAISWNENSAGDKWKARLGLVAGGVSAMPLPNSNVVFSPHTELVAEPGAIHIDGYVDIASAEIQLKQLPPETTDVSQDQEIVGQKPNESEWKIWSKLGLNLGEQFHLSGFGADVNLSGRLQLEKAPDDNMHLTGEVKVPRGRYRAYGQRLTVRKGSVIFYGPSDNPDLNLEAVRDMAPGVTDVVGMRVIGSLKTPEAILFSEPSMPDSDIAYYLLTGRKPVAGTTGTSGYSASGALLSLGLAGSEGKAGQLAEKFGITDLQLGTSETKNGQSEAEVSGQLGKDLFVRYGRGLGQQSNSISFQYRLTPKLMIETISGVDDALDLLYSFEIK